MELPSNFMSEDPVWEPQRLSNSDPIPILRRKDCLGGHYDYGGSTLMSDSLVSRTGNDTPLTHQNQNYYDIG